MPFYILPPVALHADMLAYYLLFRGEVLHVRHRFSWHSPPVSWYFSPVLQSESTGDQASIGKYVPAGVTELTGEERKRAHVYVSGRVQGVYFRAATREEARRRGVVGWVRNLPDGRVEALFEGPAAAVEGCVAWCRHGPPGAVVQDLDVTWEDPTGQLAGFNITY